MNTTELLEYTTGKELDASPLTTKIEVLCSIEEALGKIEQHSKELGKSREHLRQRIIEEMEAQNMNSCKNEKGQSVRIVEPGVYASILKDKREEALKLIREDWNAAYAVQDQIVPATLSRLVKERLEAGLDVPSEMITYYIKKKLALRKNTGGK